MCHLVTMEATNVVEKETEGGEGMVVGADGILVPQDAPPLAQQGMSICPPERSAFVNDTLKKLLLNMIDFSNLTSYELQSNYFSNIKCSEICCNTLATCLRGGEENEFYNTVSKAGYAVKDAFVHFCLSAQPTLIAVLFKPDELKNDALRTHVLNNFTLEARSQWERLAKRAMYPRPPRKRDREVSLVMQRLRCGMVNFKALEKHTAETHYLKNYMTEKPQCGSLSFHDLLASGQWNLFWYCVNLACSESKNVFVHFLLDAQRELYDLIFTKEKLEALNPNITSLKQYLNNRSSLNLTEEQSLVSPLYYIIPYLDEIFLGKADSCLALLYVEVYSGRVELQLFEEVLSTLKNQNRIKVLEKELANNVHQHYKTADEVALKKIIMDVLPFVHSELQSEFTLRHAVLIMSNILYLSVPQGDTKVYLPEKKENSHYRERLKQLVHSLINNFATSIGHLTVRYKFSC